MPDLLNVTCQLGLTTGGHFAPVQSCGFDTSAAHLLRVRHYLARARARACVCVVLIVALTELTSCVRRFTKLSIMHLRLKIMDGIMQRCEFSIAV